MNKIVVAMDSMKGCLDSYHASLWMAVGLQEAWPEAKVVFAPVSDGGEGMSQMVATGQKGIEFCECRVKDPLRKAIDAKWLMVNNCDGRSAYIDFASAAGLTLVPEKLRNPLNTTSYGVGQMIKDAINRGIRDIRLGLGGSATVDAGLGAIQALGLRLMDVDGNELPRPFRGDMLSEVANIEFSDDFKRKSADLKLTLLCDVRAPFTGKEGAAHIFGPQKGASDEDVKILEEGMENIRKLIYKKIGIDLNIKPGSGAAGGAAGGLMALAGGEIKKGASTLLDLTGFDDDIEGVDLIVTGEGSSDRQTLMGKIPFEILQRGKRKGIPVWLVAGRVADKQALLDAGFERVICINSPDIVARSGTIGKNPMVPEVAARRLASIIN